MLNHILILLLLLTIAVTLDTTTISGPLTRIRGYTSQTIQFSNPFSRQFFFEVRNDSSKDLFTFHSNSMNLKAQSSIYMGTKAKSLLQSIRSSRTENYREIIVFPDYLIVLREMYEVDIIQYNATTFTKKATYTIQDINNQSVFYKAYKYKNKAMLFANGHVYLLSNKQSYDTLVMYNETEGIAHAEWVPGTDTILLAQYNAGLGIYKIQESARRVQLVQRLNSSFFNQSYVSIENINIDDKDESKLYILDRQSGVHELKLNMFNPKDTKYVKLIVSQKGCYTMDSINLNYFVLSCQHQFQNYLIEVVVENNGTTSTMKPIFQNEYIIDVEVAPDYYISLSRKVINVYWNSRVHRLDEQYRFSNSIILPGLQTVALDVQQDTHHLFVISNNILTRYQLKETGPKIQFKSIYPLDTVVAASVFGTCETFNTTLTSSPLDQHPSQPSPPITPSSPKICQYKVQYDINIVQPNRPQKSDVSASISIIIILFVVLGILIWICIKKYTKIEEQARKMLHEFQKRNPHNNIAL